MCNSSDKSSCLGSTDHTFTGYTKLRLVSYTTENGAASSGEKKAVKLEKIRAVLDTFIVSITSQIFSSINKTDFQNKAMFK